MLYKYILFADGPPRGPSSGVFPPPSNFKLPDMQIATNVNVATNTTAGSPLTSQDIYDGNGTGDVVGINLTDDSNLAYFVFAWLAGEQLSPDAGAWSVREGATASSVDAGGVRLFNNLIESTGNRNYANLWFNDQPRSDRDAEWGLHFGNEAANAMRPAQGMLCAVLNSDLKPAVENSHFIQRGFGNHAFNDQTSGDEDITVQTGASFTLGQYGDSQPHLILCQVRLSNNEADHPSATPSALRWTPRMDGPLGFGTDIDFFNVRTNKTTGGSTRTGRGFQYFISADNGEAQIHTAATITTLREGDYDTRYVFNRWDSDDDGEISDRNRWLIWRLNIFKQEDHVVIETVQSPSSGVDWEDTVFTATVNDIDSDSPVLLVFGTTWHVDITSPALKFRLTRNGTPITNSSVGFLQHSSGDNAPDGTSGGEDTDNANSPVTSMWFDEPGAGTYTYTVQVLGDINSIFNSRDDGTDGYKGCFLAAEFKLAQENLEPGN